MFIVTAKTKYIVRSSFKDFLRGLVVFAVLVVAFEVTVSFIPDTIVADVAQQGGMKLKNDRAFNPGDLDVVILGDCFFFAGRFPVSSVAPMVQSDGVVFFFMVLCCLG